MSEMKNAMGNIRMGQVEEIIWEIEDRNFEIF